MMFFSLNYLRHLASLPKTITLEQICDAINSIGFEVESTKAFLQVSGCLLYTSPSPRDHG